MATVFVSGTLPGDGVARLRAAHDVVQDEAGVRSAAFTACRAELEGVVALLTDRIDEAFLERSPRLRVVANVAVGGGGFTGWTPTFMLGTRVHGTTLGIVGMGRIGHAMARRACGFGMNVVYTQRARLPVNIEAEVGATFVDALDDLLAAAESVSIHCPLTAATRHLFDRARLARMRHGSVLVNTARGPIVDEAALAHALEHGPLAAAGLDVFENEPRVHPALLERPNVVLAPHIGSADRPTRDAMASMAVDNVVEVLDGRPALTPVAG